MGGRGILFLPWLVTLCLCAAVGAWLMRDRQETTLPTATLEAADLLAATADDLPEGPGASGASGRFERADRPRAFVFPEDHGPHAGFRTEWWYFTGNLADRSGRRFGYQVTFFRTQLAPRVEPRAGSLAAASMWMAHFTVSDVDGGEFHDFERFARESLGIAAAASAPPAVRLQDWSAAFSADGRSVRLAAREGAVELALELESSKPPVLQGEAGLSRKNAGAGNASYYYSVPRLATRGVLRLGDNRFEFAGDSWLDREWSSGALARDQVGWDWFALQLDDGTELMWYRLRHAPGADGAAPSDDPFDAGSITARDGSVRRLVAGELAVEVESTWTSPRTGGVYPSAWRLRVPSSELELSVRPLLADQELSGTFRYWEGAVEVRGTRAGAPLAGRGYVELVGYARPGSTRH